MEEILPTHPPRQHTVVPAGGARALALAAGQMLRVVDLEGQQVGDVFAFVRDDPLEYHSAPHTRAAVGRLFPAVGEAFFTNRRRPMLRLLDDTSRGSHDMLIAACDPARYAGLGASAGHPSCAENLHRALADLNTPITHTPQPINVFMRITVDADGGLRWLPAASRAGDSVSFEALLDCVVVVSACPQDIVGINGPGPTALGLELTSVRKREGRA
ncbi:urea carboxylase-associated family protein [Actinopolymorpha sp. B9G3]|uniref:urea carboxylase-associated family protein n=1 Tax=Actinopolymorpha sp. B9G3 TaxID=3158970 RepID=UPI0032D96638